MQMQVGDVVWLKSGGPDMTVSAVGDNGLCTCRWFWRSAVGTWISADGGGAASGQFKAETLAVSGESSPVAALGAVQSQ